MRNKTNFESDPRIKFVGTVYDQQLLKFIREHALAYVHGHSVGGTNPSLLESLASTKINLLYDVGFNREVGENGALYWTKENKSLSALIEKIVKNPGEFVSVSKKAKLRIHEEYSWNYIIDQYESKFKK
ncbi:MAG: rhamnosyltransferase [Liquorilactobacillus sp.]